jgi:hypothetical protein
MPLRDHFHPPIAKRSSWEVPEGNRWAKLQGGHLVSTFGNRRAASFASCLVV